MRNSDKVNLATLLLAASLITTLCKIEVERIKLEKELTDNPKGYSIEQVMPKTTPAPTPEAIVLPTPSPEVLVLPTPSPVPTIVPVYESQNKAVVIENTILYGDNNNQIGNVELNQVVSIEREDEFMYLIRDEFDNTGYVIKERLERLPKEVIIIDISEQKLRMYQDNLLIYEAPIITGKIGNETPEGYYSIYAKDTDVYFGKYNVAVTFCMAINGDICIHDASWRENWEYGTNNRYINDGSHGCINMMYDDAEFVYNNSSQNERVLVKP